MWKLAKKVDFRKLYGPNLGFSTKKGFKIRDPQISWHPFGTKNHKMWGPPVEYAEFIDHANWNSSPHIWKINYGCSPVNLSEYLSELGQTRLPTAHVIDRDLKVCTLQFFPQVWPKNNFLTNDWYELKRKEKLPLGTRILVNQSSP